MRATQESDIRNIRGYQGALAAVNRYPIRYGAAVLLMALPLVLYLLWGTYLPDEAFVLLRQAQRLAGEGWDSIWSLMRPPSADPLSAEPLFLVLLTTSEWLALPSPAVAGLAAAAGWSAAVAVLIRLGWRIGPAQPYLVAALLLACSPLLISAGGSSSGWAVAIALLLAHSQAHSPVRRWRSGLLAVGLLLVVVDLTTILAAGLFLLWQWQRQRRPPWASLIVLALMAFTWQGWQVWNTPDLAAWLAAARRLLHESELYWLFLPALAAGLLTLLTPALRPVSPTVSRGLLLLLLAGAGGLLMGSRFAAALLAVLGLLLVGLGSAGLLAWLQKEKWLALSPQLTRAGLTLLVALPLVAAEVTSLWQRYHFRPVVWQEMEREAALWVAAESEPGSTLWASQRATYYARRPLLASDKAVLAAGRLGLDEALAPVLEEEPAYVLADSQLDWDRVTHSSWFLIRYCPVYAATADATAAGGGSAAEPRAPLTVWQFQGEPEQGAAVGLRTASGLELVDAWVEPAHIEPGDEITVSIVWKALCPLSSPFEVLVHLTSTMGERLLDEAFVVPHTIPFSQWQPGQSIEESYTFTIHADLETGAYPLSLSLNSPGSFGPDWRLYRLEDSRWVDRVPLGYLLGPWQGDMTGATPLGARFGEQIELQSARLDGEAVPGGTLTLALFWRALRPPDDAYTIFVHLLDAQDQLVAGADREPLEGRFPTNAWPEGERVGSEHPLQLPPDLAPGSYRIVTGLYKRESGERLPLVNAEGEPLPNGALPLPFVIEVP